LHHRLGQLSVPFPAVSTPIDCQQDSPSDDTAHFVRLQPTGQLHIHGTVRTDKHFAVFFEMWINAFGTSEYLLLTRVTVVVA
jgi:hypothetical protein